MKLKIIAIAVLVLLAGAAAYLYYTGVIPAAIQRINGEKPVAEAIQPETTPQKEDTTQASEVQSPDGAAGVAKEDETKEAPQDDRTLLVPEEGLRIYFSDGYKQITEERGEYIAFGPLSTENFGPDPSQKIEPTHMYRMEFSAQKSGEEIIAYMKKSYSDVVPTVEKIYGFTVVKWIDAGMCESGAFEIVGKKRNIILTSMSGCTAPEEDFTYYTKTIRAMRYID